MFSILASLILSASLCFSIGEYTGQWNVATDVTAATMEDSRQRGGAFWSYEGDSGPENWGELDPSFSTCKFGLQQSPINIVFSQVKEKKRDNEITIHYRDSPLTLINDGHNIQSNIMKTDNRIIFGGKEYRLVQFHFHTPSEHTWDGKNFDMELHLFHQAENGHTLVLSMMIREGSENITLAPMWAALPKEKTEKAIPIKEKINLQALLPLSQTAYFYNGSLTTPPCTENVKWLLFKKSIEMSLQQIQAFRTIFPDNHRPIQPLNNREITLFRVKEVPDIR